MRIPGSQDWLVNVLHNFNLVSPIIKSPPVVILKPQPQEVIAMPNIIQSKWRGFLPTYLQSENDQPPKEVIPSQYVGGIKPGRQKFEYRWSGTDLALLTELLRLGQIPDCRLAAIRLKGEPSKYKGFVNQGEECMFMIKHQWNKPEFVYYDWFFTEVGANPKARKFHEHILMLIRDYE